MRSFTAEEESQQDGKMRIKGGDEGPERQNPEKCHVKQEQEGDPDEKVPDVGSEPQNPDM